MADLRNRIVYQTHTMDYDTLIDMKLGHLKSVEVLQNKISDTFTINTTLAGVELTVFSLIFLKSTKAAVAAGLASLVLSFGALGGANVIANANFGYTRLSTAGDYMHRFGAKKVKMEVAYLEYYNASNQTVIAVIQDIEVKSYTMSDGSVIAP